jgi:hypothetical protein
MKRRLFLMAVAAAALPSLVPADESAQLTVHLTTTVAAPPAEVWSAIGDFQDMSWHPAVYSTTGTGSNAADATRRLILGGEDGPTIDEQLDTHSADAMTYSYRITQVRADVLPVTDYHSQLSVTPRDAGGSVVEWQGTFHRAEAAKDLDGDAAIAAVSGVYQAGLDALQARFGAPES